MRKETAAAKKTKSVVKKVKKVKKESASSSLPECSTPEVEQQLKTALSLFDELKMTPRAVQVDAIHKVLEAFAKPSNRYVVLEAPTGVGKSHISVALSRVFGRSYFCTLTAQLQDQMEKDFGGLGMRVLKGRGKYRCEDARASCIVGKELYKGKDACPGPLDHTSPNPKPVDKGDCPYLYAKQAAFLAPLMMANYHSFLANVGQAADYVDWSKDSNELFDPNLDPLDPADAWKILDRAERGNEPTPEEKRAACIRPFLVLDEAHTLEGFLLDQVGLHVDLKKLAGVDAPDLPLMGEDFGAFIAKMKREDYATEGVTLKPVAEKPAPPATEKLAYAEWLKVVMPRLTTQIKVVSDPEERDELRNVLRKMVFIETKLRGDEDFIIERGVDDGKRDDGTGQSPYDPTWFAAKPLRVHEYGHWLTGWGKKVLLMSATVLDAGQLVRNIGLDPKDGDFVQMGSVFPKENRPIRVYPMDQTFKSREHVWPKVAEFTDRLMTHHGREKGLLLFPSNKMLWEVRKKLSKLNQLRLIIAIGDDREQKYKEHLLNRHNSVLVASGYWEGADLKGDAARFAVIPAMPRPHWSGQIAARSKLEPRWYEWLTFCKFIQGLGRTVRSETDESITYVMDAKFVSEMNKSESLIPPWVKEAVTVANMGGEE